MLTVPWQDHRAEDPESDRCIPELSIVIPVFNEEANILQVLQALARHVPVPHEILIVYDRDEDTTLPVVRGALGVYGTVRLVKNAVAAGPSGALRSGFAQARGARILVVMADQCDDISQIGRLLTLAQAGADIVCPSRYCPGGGQLLNSQLRTKIWIPRTAGRLLRWLSGLPTADPTNSFKLYSGAMLRRLRLCSTFSFSVTLEIVAKAHGLGYRIAEIPTVWRDRQHGKSNFKVYRSILTYLPWFGAALLRGRLLRLPVPWLQAWWTVSEPVAASEMVPEHA